MRNNILLIWRKPPSSVVYLVSFCHVPSALLWFTDSRLNCRTSRHLFSFSFFLAKKTKVFLQNPSRFVGEHLQHTETQYGRSIPVDLSHNYKNTSFFLHTQSFKLVVQMSENASFTVLFIREDWSGWNTPVFSVSTFRLWAAKKSKSNMQVCEIRSAIWAAVQRKRMQARWKLLRKDNEEGGKGEAAIFTVFYLKKPGENS